MSVEKDYDSKMDYINFEDMKKYNPSFSEQDIEGKCDEDIRSMFKEFCLNNLPIDLLTFIRVFEPKNCMIYKKGYYNQTVFIRDEINGLLHSNYEEYRENPVKVISVHISKSIKLPVYLIDLKKYDTQIILRNNFYDWKVSINSKYSIIGIEDFIKPEREAINGLFCEGFEDKYIYGMYKDNNKQFTVELPSNNYILYTFFYIVRKCLIDNSNRI